MSLSQQNSPALTKTTEASKSSARAPESAVPSQEMPDLTKLPEGVKRRAQELALGRAQAPKLTPKTEAQKTTAAKGALRDLETHDVLDFDPETQVIHKDLKEAVQKRSSRQNIRMASATLPTRTSEGLDATELVKKLSGELRALGKEVRPRSVIQRSALSSVKALKNGIEAVSKSIRNGFSSSSNA